MHQYLTEENVRQKVFVGSAILSVFSGWLFSRIILILPFDIPWWVETPSVLGFFGLYIWLFDNYIWKKRPFNKIGCLYVPDISGEWDVILMSSYKGFEEKTSAKAIIHQTATKLCVSLETDNSKSFSTAGALLKTDRINCYELTYQYVNQPKPEAVKTMEIHCGTTWITLSKDKMEGEYYSGRGRQQFGKVIFYRKMASR